MVTAVNSDRPHNLDTSVASVATAPVSALEAQTAAAMSQLGGKPLLTYDGPRRSPLDWHFMRKLALKV